MSLKNEKVFGKFYGLDGCVDEAINNVVSGWVSCDNNTPLFVRITKGNEILVVEAGAARPDVIRSGRSKNLYCGYVARFSECNFEPAQVEVLSPMGILPYSARNYQNRKVFFLHIPKTAGSSVNKYLSSNFSGGESMIHIESVQEKWSGEAQSMSFLSGHINFSNYENFFGSQGRVLICFFRDPFKQLVSHFNWVRHLLEPEKAQFLSGHPPLIKKIAERMASFDLSSIDHLEEFVYTMPPIEYGLFDNYHVRFLASSRIDNRVGDTHFEEALANLGKIDIVGLAEEVSKSLSMISKSFSWAESKEEVVSNVNAYNYGVDGSDSDVRQILKPLVTYDLDLYEAAERRFIFQSNVLGGT